MINKLESKRTRLRRIKLSDAKSIASHAKSREISRYTFIPSPYTTTDAIKYIRVCHGQYRNKKFYNFGIELLETGEIIGMMSIVQMSRKYHNAEIGYWLGKKHWGGGIAREALEILLKHCFVELKLHRVYAHVMHPNTASAKLLKKAGFKFEGIARQQIKRRGKWMDMLWFGMLAGEYHKLKKRGPSFNDPLVILLTIQYYLITASLPENVLSFVIT